MNSQSSPQKPSLRQYAMPLGAILYQLHFGSGIKLDESADDIEADSASKTAETPSLSTVTGGDDHVVEEAAVSRPWISETARRALCPSPDIYDPRDDDEVADKSQPPSAPNTGSYSSYDPVYGGGRMSNRRTSSKATEDPPMLSYDIPVALDETAMQGDSDELIKTQEELRNDITELADVIRSSQSEKDKKVEFHIQTLFHSFPDPDQVVDYFLCIIRAFTEPDTPEDVSDVQHRIRIAKQVKRLLLSRGIDEMAEVDRFVISIMKEQLVDPSFLATLNLFNFFRINPIVVVDFLSHTTGTRKYKMFDQLTDFLAKFSAADMRDTLEEIVKLARWRDEEVAEYLRSIDAIFPAEYPVTEKRNLKKATMMEMVCGELNLCQLARDICLRHESLALDVDCPEFARHRLGQEALIEATTSFANGQMEMLDFCANLHDIVTRLGFDSRWLVQNLAPIFPEASKYLRRKYGYSQQDVEQNPSLYSTSQPSKYTRLPFANPHCIKNRKLHSLVDGVDEFDLSDHKRLVAFLSRVQYSDTIAASLHSYACRMLKVYEAQLLTIRVKDAIGFLPFALMDDMNAINNCIRLLNKTKGTKRIAMRNPAELLRCLDKRHIALKVDLVSIDRGKDNVNLSDLCKQVTGDHLCLRASRFILTRDTSAEAYKHQKIMASTVYFYAEKNAKLLQGYPTQKEFYTDENKKKLVERYNSKLSQVNKNKAKKVMDRKGDEKGVQTLLHF